jgi:trans-2,3-dihydro-3-hydroxyanthranilate isomerase
MTGGLPFWTLDVFAERCFAGNPLAVVGEAGSLTAAEMQAVAAELNLSETVFVTGLDEAAGRATIRIFTPRRELPFAGHPTVGTAILLAGQGLGRIVEGRCRLVLDELAGSVPVEVVAGGAGAGHALIQVLVGPDVDHLVQRPKLGVEEAGQRRVLRPDGVLGAPDPLEVIGSARLQGVGADLVDHGAGPFAKRRAARLRRERTTADSR